MIEIQGKRYPLAYSLLFTILARLSGAESYRGIMTLLDQCRDRLNRYFGVTVRRAPALYTLRNFLQSLGGVVPEVTFRNHAKGLLPAAAAGVRPIVALDGKTLRDSVDHGEDSKAAQARFILSRRSQLVCRIVDEKNRGAAHRAAKIAATTTGATIKGLRRIAGVSFRDSQARPLLTSGIAGQAMVPSAIPAGRRASAAGPFDFPPRYFLSSRQGTAGITC